MPDGRWAALIPMAVLGGILAMAYTVSEWRPFVLCRGMPVDLQ
ncbi:MAG: hypothetical protein NUW01_13445 [Gemmatimonadaceae bacterium]|nr:hypothetical protein [Gemmatimonadaceae bacterium]